ncbi:MULTISPECIES: hypothetical protein [Metallosphaera]|uniref:hypothetical protein n=1 Tax=Metallosphaera TaxID=41980 RepID=UPI001EDF9939|nr:hypothetical protein [Metallosphaera javensis (ex Hofmann et al. 2022)]
MFEELYMDLLSLIYTDLCQKTSSVSSFRRAVSAFFFIVFEEWMRRQGDNPPTGFKEKDFMNDMTQKVYGNVELTKSLFTIYFYRTLADHFYDYGKGYIGVKLYRYYQGNQLDHPSIDASHCEKSLNSARELLKFLS